MENSAEPNKTIRKINLTKKVKFIHSKVIINC